MSSTKVTSYSYWNTFSLKFLISYPAPKSPSSKITSPFWELKPKTAPTSSYQLKEKINDNIIILKKHEFIISKNQQNSPSLQWFEPPAPALLI